MDISIWREAVKNQFLEEMRKNKEESPLTVQEQEQKEEQSKKQETWRDRPSLI